MTKIYNLPDFLNTTILKGYFKEFLAEQNKNKNVLHSLDELLELSDRQWNTYQKLDVEIRNAIEDCVISVIDCNNEEIIDRILCIVPRLGLSKVYNCLIQNKKTIKNKNVIKMIDEATIEYGKDVDNPYSGLINS